MTDSSGTIFEKFDYDAYGNTLMFDSSDTPKSNPVCEFLFTGRRLDTESELYFYRARYYNPELGRFLQKDPKGYFNGVDLYEYVGGTPVNAYDPFGREKITKGNWDHVHYRMILSALAQTNSGYKGMDTTATRLLQAALPAAAFKDVLKGFGGTVGGLVVKAASFIPGPVGATVGILDYLYAVGNTSTKQAFYEETFAFMLTHGSKAFKQLPKSVRPKDFKKALNKLDVAEDALSAFLAAANFIQKQLGIKPMMYHMREGKSDYCGGGDRKSVV